MITWGWHDELSAEDLADVRGLLAAAAEYDEEAGFSTATPDAPGRGRVRHLVVCMPPRGARGSDHLDALPDERVVAYLRLDLVDQTGDVQLVVRPEFRSLGVATLLLEELASEPGGWASVHGLEQLAAWSHGAHPAADRMRMRFHARVEDAVFKTLRHVGGSRPFRGSVQQLVQAGAAEAPELVPGHHLALNPADVRVLERAKASYSLAGTPGAVVAGVADDVAGELACLALVRTPETTGPQVNRLLTQGLLLLQDDGARAVQFYLHALEDDVVSASRVLGFEHDQSDLRYAVDIPG